jgi:multidrug efflux pump subunit AcrA (membrane-fusion protein)
MKNIDFLPEIYRERTALSHARIWWGIVGLIFAIAIGSTAGAQFLLRSSTQQQIDDLAPQFQQAQQQVQRLAQLQSQIRSAGELASLVTYLEQPWPSTQFLAEVVGPLPDEIRLTELVITEEEIARPAAEEGAGPRRRRGPTEDRLPGSLSPAVSDLEALRQAHDYKRAVIEITGTVADVAILHKYVSALGRSPLVNRAQIKSLESAATVVQEKPTQFTLRLQFKPSHGQPVLDDAKASAIRVAQGGTSP